MREGQCPKCGSQSIYASEDGHNRGISTDLWHMEVITYFICTKCGYVEPYILDKESLARIEKNGTYIEPKAKK
jgi:predicted nucleic-acid-binding Zn-ribbon protein